MPDGAQYLIEVQCKRHGHLIRERLVEKRLKRLRLPHQDGQRLYSALLVQSRASQETLLRALPSGPILDHGRRPPHAFFDSAFCFIHCCPAGRGPARRNDPLSPRINGMP